MFASLGVFDSLREALFAMLQDIPALVTAKVSLNRVDGASCFVNVVFLPSFDNILSIDYLRSVSLDHPCSVRLS